MTYKKNENQIILIFLIIFFLIIFSTNISLCESISTEVITPTVEPEQSINYKKIFYYSMGIIVVIGLCYYFFTPNNDIPPVYDIKIPDVPVLKKHIYDAPIRTLREIYDIVSPKSVNAHLQHLSDNIVVQHEAYNMDIPLIAMSESKMNSLGGSITQKNFDLLYTLPGDSLVGFVHHTYTQYYQLITVEEFLALVEKFNIVVY